MPKLYKYLYYRIYSRKLKLGRDEPEWVAVLIISFMMTINMISLGLLLNLVGIRIYTGKAPHKIIIVLIALAVACLNYFIFIRSGKYKTIVKEFEKEDAMNRKTNTLLLWLYFILSFIFPLILIELSR